MVAGVDPRSLETRCAWLEERLTAAEAALVNVAGQLEAAKQAGWQAAVQHYGIREAPVAAPAAGRHRRASHLRLVPPGGVAGIAALVSWKPVAAVAATVAVVGGAAVTLAPQTIGIGAGNDPHPFAAASPPGPVAGWADDPPATRLSYPPLVAYKPVGPAMGGASLTGGASLSAGYTQAVPAVTLMPTAPAMPPVAPPTVAADPPPDPTPSFQDATSTPAPSTPVTRHEEHSYPADSPAPARTGFLSFDPPSSGYLGRHRQDPGTAPFQPDQGWQQNGNGPDHWGDRGHSH